MLHQSVEKNVCTSYNSHQRLKASIWPAHAGRCTDPACRVDGSPCAGERNLLYTWADVWFKAQQDGLLCCDPSSSTGAALLSAYHSSGLFHLYLEHAQNFTHGDSLLACVMATWGADTSPEAFSRMQGACTLGRLGLVHVHMHPSLASSTLLHRSINTSCTLSCLFVLYMVQQHTCCIQCQRVMCADCSPTASTHVTAHM